MNDLQHFLSLRNSYETNIKSLCRSYFGSDFEQFYKVKCEVDKRILLGIVFKELNLLNLEIMLYKNIIDLPRYLQEILQNYCYTCVRDFWHLHIV